MNERNAIIFTCAVMTIQIILLFAVIFSIEKKNKNQLIVGLVCMIINYIVTYATLSPLA